MMDTATPAQASSATSAGLRPKLSVRDLNFYYGGFHAL